MAKNEDKRDYSQLSLGTIIIAVIAVMVIFYYFGGVIKFFLGGLVIFVAFYVAYRVLFKASNQPLQDLLDLFKRWRNKF